MKNISIDRFILGFAGSVIFISILLAMFVVKPFVYVALFVSFMMLQASITKFCPLAFILKKFGMSSKNFF